MLMLGNVPGDYLEVHRTLHTKQDYHKNHVLVHRSLL